MLNFFSLPWNILLLVPHRSRTEGGADERNHSDAHESPSGFAVGATTIYAAGNLRDSGHETPTIVACEGSIEHEKQHERHQDEDDG